MNSNPRSRNISAISQAELLPQPAEYDLEGNIRGQLEVVEWSAGPLTGLACAVATSKDDVAEIGGVVQVPDSGRLTVRADHERRSGHFRIANLLIPLPARPELSHCRLHQLFLRKCSFCNQELSESMLPPEQTLRLPESEFDRNRTVAESHVQRPENKCT
jgi:hypothetical protein